MGRFIIELPGSQAFQPPRPRPRPQQVQGSGPDLSTVANIIRIGQALAPSPELVGDWISGSGTPAPVGPTPAELAEAAGTQQIVSAEQQAMQAAREQMAQSRSQSINPHDRTGAMTPLQSYEGAVGAVNAAQNPEQLALAQAQYEQSLAAEKAVPQTREWEAVNRGTVGIDDPDATGTPRRMPTISRAAASRFMESPMGGYRRRGPETEIAPASTVNAQMPQRLPDIAPIQSPTASVAARPAPTDARGILLAAKAAAATGDAQGFQQALSAVASADVSDMPSTSYWGAIVGDEKQKRRRLLGALMKMQVANRPDNRLGWAKFGLAEKAQGTRAKQAETNVRQVKVAERSATVREQMAFLRADAHEKTIKLKAALLASKVAKTDEQAQKMAEERIAGYVKARLAQITSGTAHIRAKTKTEGERTGLVAAQKVSEKDKHDFGYHDPSKRKPLVVNYNDVEKKQEIKDRAGRKNDAKKELKNVNAELVRLRAMKKKGVPTEKELDAANIHYSKQGSVRAKAFEHNRALDARIAALESKIRAVRYETQTGEPLMDEPASPPAAPKKKTFTVSDK